MPYRGSPKPNNRPARGRKGTLCPEWTHRGLGTDVNDYRWNQSDAHRLFEASELCPEGTGNRFATERGIAFKAVPTNDGTWHGYPVPWQDVPAELKERWLERRSVTRRELIRNLDHAPHEIFWAMESDEDD
jgi:hypothetical protein